MVHVVCSNRLYLMHHVDQALIGNAVAIHIKDGFRETGPDKGIAYVMHIDKSIHVDIVIYRSPRLPQFR